MAKKTKKIKIKERKKKRNKNFMRAGRRPSPEGTRSLFAGTISPTMCLGDGPTEGRHDKTKRKAKKIMGERKEKKKQERKKEEKKRKETN